MNINTDRFKDAPWYKESYNEKIILGGVGGIGSNALYYLTKSIPAKFHVFDDDIVSSHNTGTQFFSINSLNNLKTEAIINILSNFGVNSTRIYTYPNKIKDNILPIAIAAFDNMSARKEMFNNWKKLNNKEIFIDGRLSATIYQVFTVTNDRIEAYEKTLFDDNEVEEGPCTFKQTAHFAGLIGARITHILTNYLSNKYSNENIMNVPYLIEEYGDPFLIKVLYEPI